MRYILPTAMVFIVIISGTITLPAFAAPSFDVVATPTVGLSPTGIGLNTNTMLTYSGNGDGTVSVIDGNPSSATYNTVVNTISTSIPAIGGVAVNNATNMIYVADTETPGSVYVIDGVSTTVNPTPIPVGNNPYGIAVNDKTNLIYVANNNENTVSVIDGNPSSSRYNTVLQTLTVGTSPIAIAANENNIEAYAANAGDNTISIISLTSNTSSTLLAQKQNVIPILQSLTAANKDDKVHLSQAIESIQDSVNPNMWQTDGIHLNVKKGDQVFDDEKQAVQQLMAIISGKKEPSSFVTTLQNDIALLVGVDKGLAQTAITDATSGLPSGDSVKDISQAQKEMNDAANDANKGHFADTIDDYKNAWKQAQEALEDETEIISGEAHTHGGGTLGQGITFEFNVYSHNSKLSGQLNYQDKSAKINLHSKSITSFSFNSSTMTATFSGSATYNGKSGYTFTVNVKDNDPDNLPPPDVFQITIFDSHGTQIYYNPGPVLHGDIEVPETH